MGKRRGVLGDKMYHGARARWRAECGCEAASIGARHGADSAPNEPRSGPPRSAGVSEAGRCAKGRGRPARAGRVSEPKRGRPYIFRFCYPWKVNKEMALTGQSAVGGKKQALTYGAKLELENRRPVVGLTWVNEPV